MIEHLYWTILSINCTPILFIALNIFSVKLVIFSVLPDYSTVWFVSTLGVSELMRLNNLRSEFILKGFASSHPEIESFFTLLAFLYNLPV